MKPAYARHADGRVTFHALLKAGGLAGQPVLITAPQLTVEAGQRWVAQRLKRFHDHPGARESIGDAVLRKVIAAQGESYAKHLKQALDKHGRMELAMMLSPDSHAQAMDPAEAHGAILLTVLANGSVKGLEELDSLPTTDGGVFHRTDDGEAE